MDAPQPPAPDPVLPPGPPGFPFSWEEASDAELSWERDNMHGPNALAPLAADYIVGAGRAFAYRWERLGLPLEVIFRVWNGYLYTTGRLNAPEEVRPALLQSMPERRRALIAGTAAYWNDKAMPELRAAYAEIDGMSASDPDGATVAQQWERAWSLLDRAWQIHFFVITGPYQVLEDLADRYEALVPGAAPGDALRLVQGEVDELQEVAEDIERLVDLARDDPGVADALRTAAHHRIPFDGPFAAELAGFLARHGHLGQGWDDLQLPSWREEPEALYRELARQLDGDGERATVRRARLKAEGHRLLEGLHARLGDRPDELREFESLLESARQVGHLTETHNYWIDRMGQACIRRFTLRVGERLRSDGVIGASDDVFYLHRAEVPDLLRQPRDRRDTVAERRREHERQKRIVPPPWLGQPPEGSVGRFDTPEPINAAPDEVRGAGASAGVVRGPARVTLDQDGFDRIQPGDIVVCPSSNPSWVPVFAIAGGLVTDTGGVLSHAAVVARELGLPAVVGTREGTTRIADGRMVEVNGSTGVVRLL